jgi:Methyltransferase domain
VSPLEEFVAHLQASLAENNFRKLTLGKLRGELEGQQNVYIRLISLRDGIRLSFLHRYPDRDLTKNHPVAEGVQTVRAWLGKSSFAATLITSKTRTQLQFNRRGDSRIFSGIAQQSEHNELHDRQKNRQIGNETFLKALGILNVDGTPRKEMGDKYRQIHHFVELLAPTIHILPRGKPLRIVDLAAGKGYLTFAVYTFLKQEGFIVEAVGIERRRSLVDFCNRVAEECGFNDLRFEVGEIANAKLDRTDIVIALHACDTATDDAIYGGIASGAQIILAAPCCHKEVRPQLQPPPILAPLFKYGIQIDRMAESITDTLRSMYLEASGYATRIQEFISLDHTLKNLLIIASKQPDRGKSEQLFQRALEFEQLFGIRHQRLGDLLRSRSGAIDIPGVCVLRELWGPNHQSDGTQAGPP